MPTAIRSEFCPFAAASSALRSSFDCAGLLAANRPLAKLISVPSMAAARRFW